MKSGLRLALLGCVLTTIEGSALAAPQGQPPEQPDFAPVQSQIQEWVDKGYYPGAGMKVAQNNHVIYERYFGNYRPETPVYIASAGKWLVAATLASVVDEGKLSWDDKVSKWLPQFTDAKGQATLRQLLSHTSGFPNYQPDGAHPDNYGTLAESVEHIISLPPHSEPGTQFSYGGLAMQVAGRMAELATGKEWETLFQERIAAPMGMKNTHFTPVDSGHIPMLAGGARSTLPDFFNFLAMLANNGVFEGHRVLSVASVREMESDQIGGASTKDEQFLRTIRAPLGQHSQVYGLGEWREELDAKGRATLISSPGWAGAYPWIDKTRGIYAMFLTHLEGDAAKRDKFNSYFSIPVLPMLVRQVVDAAPLRIPHNPHP